MSEQRTVYVVTSGCYSDYRIEAIYSTLERAEAHPRDVEGDDTRVEEWTLDEFPARAPARDGWWECKIELATGTLVSERSGTYEIPTLHARSGETQWEGCDGVDVTATTISYVSAEHARKLAVEARQAWLRVQAAAGGAR